MPAQRVGWSGQEVGWGHRWDSQPKLAKWIFCTVCCVCRNKNWGRGRRKGFFLLPVCLLFGDWWDIGLPVRCGEQFPSLVGCFGLFFPFLPLLNHLYLNPYVFVLLLFLFSPLSRCGVGWASSSVAAWLLARVSPPQHFAQTPKNGIEARSSSMLWFCGNSAHWINQCCERSLCPVFLEVILVTWYRIFLWKLHTALYSLLKIHLAREKPRKT